MTDAELLELLDWLRTDGRPAWHRQAACRGLGPGPWFPVRGQDLTLARETCARCPVAGPCAEAGHREPAGMWGGVSARARHRTAA